MATNTKIAVSLPDTDREIQYFSVRVKQFLYSEFADYQQPGKVFVVSDIEGSFQSFCKILYKEGIISKYFQWTFEDNHLVILGDCFDRGEQVTECLWLIYSLEEKARKRGGHVHFILGNHEIMNMNGDWRYRHPKYADRKNGHATALYDGNNELWRWLCTKNIVEKIGDTLFVHAGIAKEIVQLGLSVDEINSLARPYYTRADETFTDPVLSLLYNGNTSPFWYRGYYVGLSSEEEVDASLKHFRVNTIVTGHTIIDRIDSFFNGKVINVNTDHASGNSEGLLIRKNKFYRVTAKGDRERIK